MKKRTQITPKQLAVASRKLARNWIKLSYDCLPPHNTMVLVKVVLGKKVLTYTGRFRYDVEDCCTIGTSWPVPLNKARHHGIVAWMPIPR